MTAGQKLPGCYINHTSHFVLCSVLCTLCVCTCVHMCVHCTCVHVHMCTCVRMCVHMCAHVCAQVCAHVCARVCACVRTCVCTFVCACVHMCAHVCACVCTCVHMCACTMYTVRWKYSVQWALCGVHYRVPCTWYTVLYVAVMYLLDPIHSLIVKCLKTNEAFRLRVKCTHEVQ